jgi:acetyl-CoA synthetase
VKNMSKQSRYIFMKLFMQIVAAFVVLRGVDGNKDEITSQIQEMVKTHVGKHCYPKRVFYLDALPRTPSGKVQRYVLKTQIK